MKKMHSVFLYWILLYSPVLFAQEKIDKRVERLRDIYKNLHTYSETGTYQTTSNTRDDEIEVTSKGKHSLYFDNVSKKMRIDAEMTYSIFKSLVGNRNFICASTDTKDNIYLLREGMNEKQEDIYTTLNRHNVAFFLSNPSLDPFRKSIFEDTIPIRVEEEVLNKTKYYRLIRKYEKPVHKSSIEEQKKTRKMLEDSLGKEAAEQFDMMMKGSPNNSFEEIYWFRKSDGALLKKIHKIAFFSDLLGVHVITTEYKFEPKLNPKLPKNIFD